MRLKVTFHCQASGCALGEDMLDTMYIVNIKAPVMVLHGMLSLGNLKLELNVNQSRRNASTNLMSCEELVKN